MRRHVATTPDITFFKPASVPLRQLQEVSLVIEEAEVLRVVDYEGIEQTEAAKKMGISQPTLSRMLASARKKIAEAISTGKALRISGGNFHIASGRSCRKCGRGLR